MKTVLSMERSKCKHVSGSISTDTDLPKNIVKLINKSLENNGLRILQVLTSGLRDPATSMDVLPIEWPRTNTTK